MRRPASGCRRRSKARAPWRSAACSASSAPQAQHYSRNAYAARRQSKAERRPRPVQFGPVRVAIRSAPVYAYQPQQAAAPQTYAYRPPRSRPTRKQSQYRPPQPARSRPIAAATAAGRLLCRKVWVVLRPRADKAVRHPVAAQAVSRPAHPIAILKRPPPMSPLNILHVFRAPVGGLFRHVLDLAREQAARGHRVGVICDSGTGGARAEEVLAALEPSLALGLTRYPMHRQPHPSDVFALRHVMGRIAATQADVVHGHGAKGGAYSRLAFNRRQAARVYIPHGGSLLFTHDTLAGKVYLATERFLMRRGDLFLFESEFSAGTFRRKIGIATRPGARGAQRRRRRRVRAGGAAARRHRSGVHRRDAHAERRRPVDRRGRALAPRRPRRHRHAGRRRARPRSLPGAGRTAGAGRPHPLQAGDPGSARRRPSAAPWWCRRASTPCPMWCWRPPPPASR